MSFTAFLVSRGQYSDYNIECVFHTKSQCIGYIEGLKSQWDFMVEYYDDKGLIERYDWNVNEAKLELDFRRKDD